MAKACYKDLVEAHCYWGSLKGLSSFQQIQCYWGPLKGLPLFQQIPPLSTNSVLLGPSRFAFATISSLVSYSYAVSVLSTGPCMISTFRVLCR